MRSVSLPARLVRSSGLQRCALGCSSPSSRFKPKSGVTNIRSRRAIANMTSFILFIKKSASHGEAKINWVRTKEKVANKLYAMITKYTYTSRIGRKKTKIFRAFFSLSHMFRITVAIYTQKIILLYFFVFIDYGLLFSYFTFTTHYDLHKATLL